MLPRRVSTEIYPHTLLGSCGRLCSESNRSECPLPRMCPRRRSGMGGKDRCAPAVQTEVFMLAPEDQH